LCSGRQVGKSTIIGIKAAQYALKNKNKTVMVIAFVEKQALLIFSKILNKIYREYPKAILMGENKPTKHTIFLKNGTEIYCYAAGETGYGIMGYTIDLLIADEAAFINEEVWNSVIPTLAATQGDVWLLSTPKLMEGFYYDCFEDPTYSKFHESSEDCPHITKEFLEDKKRRFTKAQYAQMYLGEFVDNFNRIYSDEWIKKVFTLPVPDSTPGGAPLSSPITGGDLYLGVDIAGMGDAESAFEGVARQGNNVNQIHHEVTTKTHTMETENKIIDLNARIDWTMNGIDDGGMGTPILDHLLENDNLKNKIIGLNNAKRVVDSDERTKMLYKEAMYYNMLAMGERGELHLYDCDEIKASLRCIMIEENGKIGGVYDHIANALMRACWLAKAKPLNFKVYSIKV
ncbi:hypothetical protein LCGC14_2042380, partial [marine sediment metagenome]